MAPTQAVSAIGNNASRKRLTCNPLPLFVTDVDHLNSRSSPPGPGPARRRQRTCRSARVPLATQNDLKLDVGFVFTDDLVGHLIAGILIFKIDGGAKTTRPSASVPSGR